MLSVKKILSALKTNREEFKTVFLKAQIGSEKREDFDMITSEPIDKKAFEEALEFANNNGFLQNIADILVDESLENGSLTKALAQDATRRYSGSQLQAITNAIGNFTLPDIMYRGIANGMKWTGKLSID